MDKFKKIFKVLCGIVVLILATTLISGCSSRGATATKTLTIWGFDDEDVWKPIIKAAAQNKVLKNYDIKYVKKNLNDTYENDSLNSILSGQGPDVWAIPNEWIYRHKDKLNPMPDSLIQSTGINLDEDFVPIIKQSAYFDNKLYALSPTVDTLMVYYNEKLFQSALEHYNDTHAGDSGEEARKNASRLLNQVPVTWTDFTEAAKIINVKNGNSFTLSGVALGTSNNIKDSEDILYTLMLQDGCKMTSDNYDLATFNLPQSSTAGSEVPGTKALDFYNSFANQSSANYSWNMSMPNNVEAFVSGKAAMIFGYESLSNYLSQIYPGFEFKKAAFPQIGTSNETVLDYGAFTAFTNPKLSANSDAAWEMIYLLSTDQASSYANTIQISQSAKKNDFQPSLKDREGIRDPGAVQTQTATTWIKGRYPIDVDSAMKTAIESVATGAQSSQAALDLAASTTTTLLRKNTW